MCPFSGGSRGFAFSGQVCHLFVSVYEDEFNGVHIGRFQW